MADFHLEDNPLTEYRWKIFPWIKETIKDYEIDELIILGDLTEKKDKHNANLVRRIVENILAISFSTKIHILCGNHDYINTPFFSFFNEITKNIIFYDEPDVYKDSLVFIPHMDNDCFVRYLNNFSRYKEGNNYFFIHQEISGIKLPNNHTLTSGVSKEVFNDVNVPIFSGHIHQPMKVGKVEYIGAPYPIYFGDNNYSGRAMLLDTDAKKSKSTYIIPSYIMSRWLISIDYIEGMNIKKELGKYKLSSEEQAKIRVYISRDSLHLWESIKKEITDYCNKEHIVLVSVEMMQKDDKVEVSDKEVQTLDIKDIIKKYAKKEKLDLDYIETAIRIVK